MTDISFSYVFRLRITKMHTYHTKATPITRVNNRWNNWSRNVYEPNVWRGYRSKTCTVFAYNMCYLNNNMATVILDYQVTFKVHYLNVKVLNLTLTASFGSHFYNNKMLNLQVFAGAMFIYWLPAFVKIYVWSAYKTSRPETSHGDQNYEICLDEMCHALF